MSEDLDHQEIQVALQAAKLAAHNKIRSRFHSSSDLIHRLFVCISGVLPNDVWDLESDEGFAMLGKALFKRQNSFSTKSK